MTSFYKKLNQLFLKKTGKTIESISSIEQNTDFLLVTFCSELANEYHIDLEIHFDGDIIISAVDSTNVEISLSYILYDNKYDVYDVYNVYHVLNKTLFHDTKIEFKSSLITVKSDFYYLNSGVWELIISNTYFKWGGFIFPKKKILYKQKFRI